MLVVRHGPGRGRLPGYMQPLFDHVRAAEPRTFASLAFWETGSPPPDLDGIRAVLLLLGDPLRELYPDCFREAAAVADAARARGIRVANPPEALSRTIKSVQSRLWREAGIPTPPHEPFATLAELEAAIGRTTFPAILRGDRVHCQRGMVLCPTAADVRGVAPGDVPLPGTLTPFVDTRAGWRVRDPSSPLGRLYHKRRAFVLGRRVRAHNLFLSESPIVGLAGATIACPRRDDVRLQPLPRLRAWMRRREAAREDLRYFDAGPEHADVLVRACEVLGLSWTALDYATTADGGIVVWEANPYPSLMAASDPVFAAQLRRPERLSALYADMAALFADLAAGA